jgi:hypothetical protein
MKWSETCQVLNFSFEDVGLFTLSAKLEFVTHKEYNPSPLGRQSHYCSVGQESLFAVILKWNTSIHCVGAQCRLSYSYS